jgi:hypothetical protein
MDDNVAQIRSFLLDLVPEAGDKVRWHDIFGGEHTAAPVISARKQTIVLERIRTHSAELASAFKAVSGGKGIEGLMVLLADASTIQVLVDVFETIHPTALAKALEHPDAAWLGTEDRTCLDVFTLEDMVLASAPFFARPLGEVLGASRALRKAQT